MDAGNPCAIGVADAILDCIFARRRLLANATSDGASDANEAARAPHLARVQRFVEHDTPIELVLPGFPAKAPNPTKVLGRLPDRAERLGLEALDTLLVELTKIHPPGARLTLCSDGHVFADAVGVSDEDVVLYRRELDAIIAASGLTRIRMFGLSDAFAGASPRDARRALEDAHAVCVDEVRSRARDDFAHRAQLDGIHRFLFEDFVAAHPDVTRSQARRLTRTRAYEVVRRSDAWSRLVAKRFPDALRLSIHPQPDVSEKIGIAMSEAHDAWLTPWHGVALIEAGKTRLVRRHEAEARGAVVVHERGRASHMEVVS